MIGGTLRAATTSADLAITVEVTDYIEEDLIDLSGVTEITVQVRDSNGGSVLSATLSGGTITVLDTGIFRFTFTAAQMGGLSPGTYDIGITLVESGKTLQILLGSLPVVDGIVR